MCPLYERDTCKTQVVGESGKMQVLSGATHQAGVSQSSHRGAGREGVAGAASAHVLAKVLSSDVTAPSLVSQT
jgi:hypothetical protein